MVCINQNTAQAGSVTLSPPEVLSDGGVVVSATGTFDTCQTCDQYGNNCLILNSGKVYLNLDDPALSYLDCTQSGSGSAHVHTSMTEEVCMAHILFTLGHLTVMG